MHIRPNLTMPCSFFPATLYLSTSKVAVAALGNLAFVTALLLHRAIIKVQQHRSADLRDPHHISHTSCSCLHCTDIPGQPARH